MIQHTYITGWDFFFGEEELFWAAYNTRNVSSVLNQQILYVFIEIPSKERATKDIIIVGDNNLFLVKLMHRSTLMEVVTCVCL